MSGEQKHITDQPWTMKVVDHPDGRIETLIVGADGSIVARLLRADFASDQLIAGYICGMQHKAIANRTGPEKKTDG